MSELEMEIVNNILMTEVYKDRKDKLLLELELDKVSDRLSIGLLTELLIKDGWEADKDMLKEILANIKGDNDLTECHKYFVEEITEWRKTIKRIDPKVLNKTLKLFGTILTMAKESKDGVVTELSSSEEFVNELKSCNKEEVEYFKGLLLESEKYEILAQVDKILA